MANKNQTYNDGILNIFKVENIAEEGNLPKEGLTPTHTGIRYSELKVYDVKYWAAMQEKTKIVSLLRIPKILNIKTSDVIVLPDQKQYRIVQLQYPPDVSPKSIDISLENIDADYEESGDTNEIN